MQLQGHITQARALREDILGSPTIWLPRREFLLEWLNGFLTRAKAAAYELGETEAHDLDALGEFLRSRDVPVAA